LNIEKSKLYFDSKYIFCVDSERVSSKISDN